MGQIGGPRKIQNYRKANVEAMQDKCVCLSVKFGAYGRTRGMDPNSLGPDVNPDRTTASKRIMDSDNLNMIYTIWKRARGWIWTKCLPAPLRAGMYLCPLEFVEEVDRKLIEFEQEAQPYIKALVKELPKLKRMDARPVSEGGLGDQYNPNDYPTAEALERAFYVEAQYVDFRVPDKLARISTRFLRDKQSSLTKAWEEAGAEVNDFLRETMKYLVDEIVEKLGTQKDGKRKGKPKIFMPTLTDKLSEFMADFDARNITDNAELKRIVLKAKNTLDGIDVQELRDDTKLRAQVRRELGKITAQLEEPGRAIELE